MISRLTGSPEAMRGQLERLLEVSEWLHVTLQVLPLSSGVHPALNGPFCILEFPERSDPEVVYSDGVAGHAYLERESGVRTCTEAFDLLRAAALSPADTVKFIGRMVAGPERHQLPGRGAPA